MIFLKLFDDCEIELELSAGEAGMLTLPVMTTEDVEKGVAAPPSAGYLFSNSAQLFLSAARLQDPDIT